jgi:hypothetical protein
MATVHPDIAAAEEALIGQARAETGLSDFGEIEEFRVGLRVLIAAAAEADLSEAQRLNLQMSWRANLAKRLWLVDLRNRRPQIARESIDGPLVVVGLPRTGTSALVDLLAQDPAARAPLQWETGALFPPPDRDAWAEDPRIAQLQARFDADAGSNPIVALGLHTFGARLPDECNSFMALNFWSPNLAAATLLPRYVEWLRLSRPERPYMAHRWVLQHLQAHGPAGRWTLKSPFHAFGLAELVAEYPGAMLVQTHRDPVELLASNAGLLSTIRGFGPGHPGRLATGREQVELWGTGLQRALAARADPSLDARVFDLSHRALIDAPMEALRSVYDHFRLPFTAEAERRARAWLDHPAQHRSSVRFTLEDFGLTAEDVERAFGPYRERFSAYF